MGFYKKYKDYLSIENKDIQTSKLPSTIIFPDQPANQILNGYPKGSMPDEYIGGVGKEGVANLKKFVEDGGTLVFLNRSSNFAIEQFNLPVKNVTQGLNRREFYIPGSILRTELDINHPIAKGMDKQSIARFEQSPAFEILDQTNVEIIGSYPTDASKILLSGWALGAEKLAGKAALVSVKVGKGKIVLFGFDHNIADKAWRLFHYFLIRLIKDYKNIKIIETNRHKFALYYYNKGGNQ